MTVWTVPAVVEKVTDADSIWATCDLGFRVQYHTPIRIGGIDAPELRTAEGKAARAFLTELLPAGTAVTFESQKLEKYGRALGAITLPDGRDLATVLLEAGHAVQYGA